MQVAPPLPATHHSRVHPTTCTAQSRSMAFEIRPGIRAVLELIGRDLAFGTGFFVVVTAISLIL